MMIKGASTDQQVDHSFRQTVRVVGFNRRLIAAIIDGLLIGVMTFALTVAIGMLAIFTASFDPNNASPFDRLIILGGVIVSIVYYVSSWAKSGQTLGKSVTGMKIVGTDGAPPSWGQALLRYVGYIISGLALSLGFIWLAFDPKRQGWHDKIARTYVVNEEATFDEAGSVEFVPTDPGRNWLWLIIWVVLAISMPGALLTSLWILGPVVNRFAKLLSSLL
ncbi:MAG TPA: RDD family protein [Anaerolineae bacterium]|nr:RDD family protein [Anaerolineae bacterium]